MSSAAPSTLPATAQRVALFYQDVVGKKIAMAVSGAILFGYVVGHMAGNLQVFLGREKINAYAEFLHSSTGLLWGVRALLLVAVLVHAYTGIWLAAYSRAARPTGYKVKGRRHPNLAARTMALSGVVLGVFIVFHLLHLTTGTVHPDFIELHPYENMVRGFGMAPVALFYVLSVALLGLHLYHGAWSMFHSVGISNPRVTPVIKKLAALFAGLLAVGFATVPLAIMIGIID